MNLPHPLSSDAPTHGAADPTFLRACPRCGHGLGPSCDAARRRGEASVTCAECGLSSNVAEIEAGDVGPPWFVESPRAPRSLARRAVETGLRASLPYGFWRQVPTSARLRPWRIALFLVAILAAAHAVAVVARAIDSWPRIGAQRVPAAVIADLAQLAAFPASPYAGSDLLRVAAKGDPNRGIGLGTLVRFVTLSARGMSLAPTLESPFVVPSPDADGAFAADRTFQSFAEASALAAGEGARLASTRVAAGAVVVSADGRAIAIATPEDQWAARTVLRAFAGAVEGTALPAIAVLLLWLLPSTLRRAKARPALLVRAAAYAAVAIPPAMTAFLLAAPRTPGAEATPGHLAIGAFMAAFTVVWLHAICRGSLRVRHAAATSVLISVVAVLVLVAASEAGSRLLR